MAVGYWATGYWQANYWALDGNYWPEAGAQGVVEVEDPGGGAPGGKYGRRRRDRYPRRITIEGRVHVVQNAEEERQLLLEYRQRLEAEKAALEAQEETPRAEVGRLRVKVARVERRLEEADDREAEWKAKLRAMDRELILLLGG